MPAVKRTSQVKQMKKVPSPKDHIANIPKIKTERHVEKPIGKRF